MNSVSQEIVQEVVVTVPDLAPEELVAFFKNHLTGGEAPRLEQYDERYQSWDFFEYRIGRVPPKLLEARGKRYAVILWKPFIETRTSFVKRHFLSLNADGNTAAFITYMAQAKPKGLYATIPESDALLHRSPHTGTLSAPTFRHSENATCALGLRSTMPVWEQDRIFVAFRSLT